MHSFLTNCRGLYQSHDSSCYISRRKLAPPPLWLHKHIGLRALSRIVIWSRLSIVICSWNWILCGFSCYNKQQIYVKSIIWISQIAQLWYWKPFCAIRLSHLFWIFESHTSQSAFIYCQVSQENIFVHFVDTFCVFVSLCIPVSKFEVEHSASELKR